MYRPTLAVLTLLTFGLVITGCELFEGEPKTNHGVSNAQFSDIPVPAGMKLLDHQNQSHSVQAGDYRFGEFVYTGSIPLHDASSYMMQRMPQHNWKLVADEVPTPESRMLRFERGNYVAECRFLRESATTRMDVKVTTVANGR